METPSRPVLHVFAAILRTLDAPAVFHVAMTFRDEPEAVQLAIETEIARRWNEDPESRFGPDLRSLSVP